MRPILHLLLLAALGQAVSASAETPQAVLDALFPGGRRTESLSRIIESATPEPGREISVQPIGRDAHSSHHSVSIRGRERPHRHLHHDLLVIVLKGHGSMLLGSEERIVGAGSILFVPRGTTHAFRNRSEQPAIAYAVYTPAFDGLDRVFDD